MKRLFILTALVVAATVTTCTADTIGLFRAVVPPDAPQFENKVLWLLFAPQPEPPKIANDGRTIQIRQGSAIASLDVWVLVEGADASRWHLNGSARLGVDPSPFDGPSPFYLNVGQRLAGGGVLGASLFMPIEGDLPETIALPPGAPTGPWLGGRFSVGCAPGTADVCSGLLADPTEVEVWVDTGVFEEEGWVPDGSAEGVDPDGSEEGIVPVTAVPEPATLLLLGIGLLGLGARQRRRF